MIVRLCFVSATSCVSFVCRLPCDQAGKSWNTNPHEVADAPEAVSSNLNTDCRWCVVFDLFLIPLVTVL